MTKHYLEIMEEYLLNTNSGYTSVANLKIEERNKGKKFSYSEHLKGLIYSLLSNQRPWSGIVPHLKEIDKIFYDYDVNKIKSTDSYVFEGKLKEIKCGNRSIKKQMKGLKQNIEIFDMMVEEYGSIDNFITSRHAFDIVRLISMPHSKYKMENIGEPLAWEYLRNVGIDGAKPDVHLNRFLGNGRMGKSKCEISTIDETLKQVVELSEETGMTMTRIDGIIWSYCSNGYGEICTINPKCDICVIKEKCRKDKKDNSKFEKAEFTNMCMIYDDKGNVLVQNRVKSWYGYAFPGGHLEPMESIVDSVIREIKEETGLTISNLVLCGVKQAFMRDGGRYIVFLYKTNCFTGELLSIDEGKNFWMPLEELKNSKDKLADNFEYMLEVFTNDELSEHYHHRKETEVIDIVK